VVGDAVLGAQRLDLGPALGATFATMTFWFAVRRNSPSCTSAISPHPGQQRGPPGTSRSRPFSMNSVRWCRPFSPSTQP
jgi:hypothetical protein